MTGFVECRDTFFLVRDHAALLLRTDSDFYKGLLDIILSDIGAVIFCRNDRSFIQKIFKICTGKSCCCLCDLF